MSASSEYEPTARQDYGPAASSENFYEHLLDPKLTSMNVPSVRTPVLRAVPLSPNVGDPEPDSTNPENLLHSMQSKSLDKETEYHITEKNTEMPIESLSGIVRIEEGTIDTVGRIAYPIIQEADDSSDANYVENTGTTIIQAPISTAIVQNVAKLPQNFTINVDAANITTLQNVSQDMSGGSQTLWLPTILATSAPTAVENKPMDDDRSGVSQIIIASESYEANQIIPRQANIVSDASYITRPKNSKVQILSNISIPKNTYCQQFITPTGKEVATAPMYGTQNHVYKLSTNVITQKHLNNSVLCTKPPKSQSLIGCPTLSPTVINSSPIKNVSYGHTIPKGPNLNKTLNKVNNGANLNAVVAASSGNTQCHILSRVVSGSNKVTVHSGRKSVNTFKGSKNSSASGSPSNAQKGSRAIKIIQQTLPAHKNESKNWPVTKMATYKGQSSYNVVESNSKIIQKVGSPTHKSQQHVALQKVAAKGERLVLQSPCGPVVVAAPAPGLRYVHGYGAADVAGVAQITANQQLTAQILQSLSQPKMLLSTNIVNHNIVPLTYREETADSRPVNRKRIVVGDPSTLLTADDIIGMEERPNLSEELMRYSYQSLAFIMLDHTYALSAQKQPAAATASTPDGGAGAAASPPRAGAPASPLQAKGPSPVVAGAASYETPPLTTPTIVVGAPIPVTSIQMSALTYKPQPPDDDTASVISSDGERRQGDRDGSDTETAPEGEEEGKTRCICDFTHDDGYMICCDRCGEWQHVDCMGIDRQNIPDAYMCELCQPRPIDRRHARSIQLRKREELSALGASDTDSSEGGRPPGQRRKRLLTVTTYTNTTGSCVTTYNSNLSVLPPLPTPTIPLPKRGPKKPKKAEVVRKSSKRKLTEKRVKRKKEMMMNRSKYNSSMSNQSHWQESYELAMTNHYSPELRAKIIKYSSKLANTPNMASAITAHLCTTVPHAGSKILIATRDLKENTPVIELRGKYMLSNQHRPQVQNSARAGSQKPGPFVFFYRLPKDNTQICIDTRTYGNEARFVRRSCKPNAELQHCIVKGALHVYLVTIGTIQSNTEITVGHDSNGGKQPCACGNPKHCKANGLNSIMTRKTCDYPPREKRMRNRCTSSSSPVSPPIVSSIPIPIKEVLTQLTPIKIEKKSPIKLEFPPMSPVKTAIIALKFEEVLPKEEPIVEDEKPEMDLTTKEELKPDIDEPDFCPIEPKVEAKILEKIEEPPQEPPELKPEIPEPPPVEEEIKEELKETKVESEPMSDDEKPVMKEVPSKPIEEERVTRNNVAAKSACHDRSSRSSRTTCVNQDSMDDKTDDSQDKIQTPSAKDKKKMTREERKMEAIMKAFERMEKAEQRKQEVKERQKRRESDPTQPSPMDKDDEDEMQNKKRRKRKGRARTSSQSAACGGGGGAGGGGRRRLDSADSELMTSGDEAPEPRDHHISEGLGLSSACLLVEAAVGSVESAFKLPKTKKTMATEWLGRSPERTPSPYRSPYRPSLVNATSLESLVRVASTMIGDLGGGPLPEPEAEEPGSPPRTPGRDRNKPPKKAKRITRNTPPEIVEVVPSALPQHSAKKRWLRQAISEESDSPTAESPPNEIITPLKKRRLARESLSYEQPTFVPCNDATSPNLTSEDSPVKIDNRLPAMRQCKMRSIDGAHSELDRRLSGSGHGSDDQAHADDVLNVDLRGAHDSEDIRRIIGVPAPEDMRRRPTITRPEDIGTGDDAAAEAEPGAAEPPPPSPDDKADTSGGSSPQRDEMDDIQKKIHSFHTENIQILKIRNKKPPKEKRKKVNLNFDLNMVDDRISVRLRTEGDRSPEVNGDLHDRGSPLGDSVDEARTHYVSTENIPLPPVESIPLPGPENIPLPEEPVPIPCAPPPETIPLPEEPTEPATPASPRRPETPDTSDSASAARERSAASESSAAAPFASKFGSTGLFSSIFTNMNSSPTTDGQIDENVPSVRLIKNAIDRTAHLDNGVFDKEILSRDDELKSVQEILTRVNNMESGSSAILSGVLRSSDQANKPRPCARAGDPRLHAPAPAPAPAPAKPARRKLSISEYRKRHAGAAGGEADAWAWAGAGAAPGDWSSGSSGAGSLSPLRLDAAAAAAADDLEQRLHRAFGAAHHPKGVFDAQPTAAERVREKLSSRLRREFGLALPDEAPAPPARPDPPAPATATPSASGAGR